MSSTKRRTGLLLILPLSLLLASGCSGRVRIQPQFPPAQDVEASTTAKPLPRDDSATNSKSAAQDSADIETWGDTIRAAAIRACLWMNDRGAKFDCHDKEQYSGQSQE